MFPQTINTRVAANDEIYKRILDDEDFRETIGEFYLRKVYERLREGSPWVRRSLGQSRFHASAGARSWTTPRSGVNVALRSLGWRPLARPRRRAVQLAARHQARGLPARARRG